MRRTLPRVLRVGERVRLCGRIYRVALVNQCRARLELCGGERVRKEFETERGEAVVFDAWDGSRYLDVSPTSIVERVS